MSSIPVTPRTAAEYKAKYLAAKMRADKVATLTAKAKKLHDYKDSHYARIAKGAFGDAAKWWIPAVIHNQEAGGDVGIFKAVLHNGERIIGTGRKTTIVPEGLGPFNDFVVAGVDALKKIKISDWSIGGVLEYLEKFNGLGYRTHGVASPYLWAMTDQYTKGHYAGDHNWKPNEVSQNYGVAGILKAMEVLGFVSLNGEAPKPEIETPKAEVKPVGNKKITRDQLVDAMLANVKRLVDLPVREDKGKNRSVIIDSWNKRAGAPNGTPYCAASIWCEWKDVCDSLGLKFPMRPTAASQAFVTAVPAKYVRKAGDLGKRGDAGVLQVSGDPGHGHMTLLREDQKPGSKDFATYEFNTGPSGSFGAKDRDGDGGYAKIRNTVDKSSANGGKLFRAFADIPQWIIDSNS